jgi:hypothetical protein
MMLAQAVIGSTIKIAREKGSEFPTALIIAIWSKPENQRTA